MKNWKKPAIVEVVAKQLSNYINVAAKSLTCIGEFSR